MKFTFVEAIMYICIPLYIFAFFLGGGLGALIAGVCLPAIICGCIYYFYKKLNDKLDKIEKMLKDKDKADKVSILRNNTSKK